MKTQKQLVRMLNKRIWENTQSIVSLMRLNKNYFKDYLITDKYYTNLLNQEQIDIIVKNSTKIIDDLNLCGGYKYGFVYMGQLLSYIDMLEIINR